MTNSEYRLNSDEEWKELEMDDNFVRYREKVLDAFRRMRPGSIIRLTAPAERMPWLIKITCWWVISDEGWKEYDLNDDYTKLRRLEKPFM